MVLDLNHLVVLSVVILTIISILAFIVLIPVASQLTKTLASLQVLLNTLNEDLNPTLKDIRTSVDSIKSTFIKSKTYIKSGLENVRLTLFSSGFGVFKGLKEYFNSYSDVKKS